MKTGDLVEMKLPCGGVAVAEVLSVGPREDNWGEITLRFRKKWANLNTHEGGIRILYRPAFKAVFQGVRS